MTESRKILALVALVTALLLFGPSPASANGNIEVGKQAVVYNVHPVGLLVQAAPGLKWYTLKVIHENQEVTVIQGPYWADGVAWYLVWGDEGRIHGWSAGKYLRPKEVPVAQPQPPAEEVPPPAEEAQPQPSAESSQASARTGSSRGEAANANSFVARVTAYALVGYTRSGTWTKWGTVAVDPNVIPLGSKLMIEGLDTVFVAEDTGGGVKGNWVDIWFPSYREAIQWGVQYRRITVLGP
jgi:3D (Asp-Asp-Asp) domain-containing protein